MIQKIINNHTKLNTIYYNKLDKLRETFDFNDMNSSFILMEKYGLELKKELEKHFEFQIKLKNQINSKVDKLILENMLVKDILLRMCNKIVEGGKNKNVEIFNFFDDFEEIFKAYLKKEEGLFIQELKMITSPKEQEKIKDILS